MTMNDRLFGEIEITEPVIVDLIQSPTLERLKGIDQGGYKAYYPGDVQNRFEHSVGVYWLLRISNASLEEQIAGLIHDVSHTAFSHAIDYVLEGGSEVEHTFQDRAFNAYVAQSEIPTILATHGFILEHVLDDNRHPLKERLLPDLCADRIDYALRAAIAFGILDQTQGQTLLSHLHAIGAQWVFDDATGAKQFADVFRELNGTHWSGIAPASMFYRLAAYLKYAVKHGYIRAADFYQTDRAVLDTIAAHHANDQELQQLFDVLDSGKHLERSTEPTKDHMFCKSRVVDPLIAQDGHVCRLSDVHAPWRDVLIQESKPKEYYFQI
jgi:hypothetical protein